MDIERLITALGRASAYPWLAHAQSAQSAEPAEPAQSAQPAEPIQVIQTHISVVFLVGGEVFKLHKPVDLGFLDFRTLDARRRDCEAEVEVNAALAPGVYRGVVAIVRRGSAVVVERDPAALELASPNAPEILEWAVWMRRLPESATFAAQLERRELGRPQLWELAATLARFYAEGAEWAAANPERCRLGDVETVTANVRENFTQLDEITHAARAAGLEPPIDGDLLARLRAVTEAALARVRALIHHRWEAGEVRDTHGDLRVDHVYDLGRCTADDTVCASANAIGDLLAATGGRSLLIIDRIEFNERFRWADPISDVAFLAMDLRARGAWQLADCFVDDFLAARDDSSRGLRVPGASGALGGPEAPDDAQLLRFYAGYRATVRAKIAAMLAAEPEIDADARAAAITKAAARARLALAELAPARERPCLVLVAGLPGTGKSVLARGLRETGDFAWIRSDELRKRLAGLEPTQRGTGAGETCAGETGSGEADWGAGIYTAEWTARTYAACLDRAAEVCLAGGRALVDATFLDAAQREAFVAAAIRWGVPTHLLITQAPVELVRERLARRQGDPSDADWAVYLAAAARWSPVDPNLCRTAWIDASSTPHDTLAAATRVLITAGLL